MSDPFINSSTSLDSPARSAFEVTPDNDEDMPSITRGLYIGTQGDVRVQMWSGDVVTFSDVVGVLPVCVRRVYATGTEASAIVALL